MILNSRYHTLIFSLVPLIFSCTTQYYIVRHAEKDSCNDCATCSLSVEGRTRANTLADSLNNKGIDNIFASECIRTQLTAQPLSNRLNQTIENYQTSQLNAFIAKLKNFKDQRSILVVGHSNQIPIIIDSLANRNVVISENDFDNLFLIKKKKFLSTISFESTTYGAETQ